MDTKAGGNANKNRNCDVDACKFGRDWIIIKTLNIVVLGKLSMEKL